MDLHFWCHVVVVFLPYNSLIRFSDINIQLQLFENFNRIVLVRYLFIIFYFFAVSKSRSLMPLKSLLDPAKLEKIKFSGKNESKV